MKPTIAVRLTAALFALCSTGVAPAADDANEPQPTNVVVILIDDLGWEDLGCYGSTYYQTPHIDRLAADGLRFTSGYAACNVCSPTRAAIMTGKYPARLLITQWLPSGRWDPQKRRLREARYLTSLPLEEVTIAEALRESGYATGFFGKWHLGALPYYYPEHQGFDLNVAGRDYGAPGSYFYPFEGTWKIPTTGKELVKDAPLDGEPGDYLTDRLTDEVETFIRDSADRPFLAFLSHYAVHTPLQGKPELVKKYERVPKQDRQGQPRYAAMVESVDESVGRIVAVLKELELEERTLIIFTSDNGGYARATTHPSLRGNKGTNYEGGLRVPLIMKWPQAVAAGRVTDVPAISTDLYPTILAALELPPRPHQHLDGVNLLPLLKGEGGIDREALYWHYPHYNQHPDSFPSGAVRRGDWKLIESFETGECELYNLADDLAETTNRADELPERTSELRERLADWRRKAGADSMRVNPQFVGANGSSTRDE